MPGKKYRSIKNPKAYEALREKGISKQSAAAISNSQAKGKRMAGKPEEGARDSATARRAGIDRDRPKRRRRRKRKRSGGISEQTASGKSRKARSISY